MALSTFAEANLAADARAFTALMAYLRRVDGEHCTVILVQVENEVGMLGSARDHSAEAEAAWQQHAAGVGLLADHVTAAYTELATAAPA